jgi:adenylate kinase family enzyme
MANARMDSSEEEKEPSAAVEEASIFPFSSDVEIRPVEKPERDLCADNSSGRFKHRVFISHRGTQKQNIAFPMMAIFSYFCGREFAAFDRVTFELGEENRTAISKALSQSLHCLVIISKDFFQSKWTVKEVDAFFRAIEKNPDNPKRRKIIPLFMGLSPAECRSLKRSDYESLSEKDFERCRRVAEQLSRISGLEQHERFEVSEESEKLKGFILNQMSDLLKNHLCDGNEPSLLPDFQNQVTPELLAYIYNEAVSYYQRVNGEMNMETLLELIRKQRLQNNLRAQYKEYGQLKRLFDGREIPIVDSFINLALIKETEHKEKEKGLGRGTNLEEKEENEKEFIDERMASYEELYAVKEPLALNQLFEPKNNTETPNKILILGRAGIGKTTLCQYLVVQWASCFPECKDEEQRAGVGNYLRQKFDVVFWIRLRAVADFLNPSHIDKNITSMNVLGYVIHKFCLMLIKDQWPEEIETYIQLNKNKILFILDGYDEITGEVTQSRYLNDFLDRIKNQTYALMTSRPLAIDALEMTFDRKLENIGFTNENIGAYVRHFMRDAEKPTQIEPMLKFLTSHPSVWGIAHIPINLNLLSWLWSEGKLTFKQGQTMTLSKLYDTIVRRIRSAFFKKLKQPKILMNSSLWKN